MLYCCFGAWLPVCSVLNLAELLRRAPTSTRNRGPMYLFQRALDCRSWTEQIRSTLDLLEVHTETKVKLIRSAGVAETRRSRHCVPQYLVESVLASPTGWCQCTWCVYDVYMLCIWCISVLECLFGCQVSFSFSGFSEMFSVSGTISVHTHTHTHTHTEGVDQLYQVLPVLEAWQGEGVSLSAVHFSHWMFCIHSCSFIILDRVINIL